MFDKCAFYPTFVDNHASIQVFLNMRPLRFLSFAVLIEMVLLSGCNPKTKTVQHRLVAIDSLMTKDPRAAWDTLAQFDFNLLREREKAYYGLLFTIAQHKNGIPFTSDSTITKSREWYERQVGKSYELARALFYNGLVIYTISNDGSRASQFMRDALQIMKSKNIEDDKLHALICAYLGKINDRNEQNLLEAISYYQEAVIFEERTGNKRNLLIDECDLLVCLAKVGAKEEAKTLKAKIDSTAASSPVIRLESLNNARSIYFLHFENNLDSALFYCQQWKPNPKDKGAKENLLSTIYRQLGQLDSAIAYEKASYIHRYSQDTLSYHLYYKHLADCYEQLGNADSTAYYARLAYSTLHNYLDRKTEKRVLELEKQYDLTAKEVDLAKVRHHRSLLAVSLAALALLAGGLVLLLRNRSRELRAEKITRSFVQAAAKTHQNTLSLLKPLTTKPKSSTVEGLQASIAGIATDLRKGFTKNFSKAIEENKGALTSRQLKNLEKLNGERAKTIFILSELGYTEQEIAEYTCTSVDSVRTMTNNNKRITDSRSSRE